MNAIFFLLPAALFLGGTFLFLFLKAADQISSLNPAATVKVLGIPARFIPQAPADKILAQMGLDADGLLAAARALLG